MCVFVFFLSAIAQPRNECFLFSFFFLPLISLLLSDERVTPESFYTIEEKMSTWAIRKWAKQTDEECVMETNCKWFDRQVPASSFFLFFFENHAGVVVFFWFGLRRLVGFCLLVDRRLLFFSHRSGNDNDPLLFILLFKF